MRWRRSAAHWASSSSRSRELEPADLDGLRGGIADVLFRRASHVVTENARVLRFAAALESGDAEAAGLEMHESHESLRTDYEVTWPEADFLVDRAAELEGVHGARMTGAGWGGCTVQLIEGEAADARIRSLVASFREDGALRRRRVTGRHHQDTARTCLQDDGLALRSNGERFRAAGGVEQGVGELRVCGGGALRRIEITARRAQCEDGLAPDDDAAGRPLRRAEPARRAGRRDQDQRQKRDKVSGVQTHERNRSPLRRVSTTGRARLRRASRRRRACGSDRTPR